MKLFKIKPFINHKYVILMARTSLYCVFFFVLALNSMAINTYSQTVRLSVDINKPKLKDAILEIKKQTEFDFLYSKDIEPLYHANTHIKIEEGTIEETLDQLFKNSRISYQIVNKTIVLTPEDIVSENNPVVIALQLQQGIRISGVVTEGGEPLPGVNVVVKGTTIGVTTDIDGSYNITIPDKNSILAFSYIGFTTKEFTVGDKTVINVLMESDTQSLEEVVVIGYGIQKKSTLTGSVSAIGSEEIAATKSENTISNLQGKVSGLMIRQQTGEPGVFDNLISIRGYGTPLVVIDGVTRPGYAGTTELAQLNSEDIESVSILKDASASIYGMNAANGVIIVTTKKGQDGKARISYSNLTGMKRATGMEFTVDAYTYRVMANEMQRNIGAAPTYSDEILNRYKNNEPGYTDWNWVDMFMKDWAFQQQHNISIRGGTEKIKYFNSFGYTQDDGLIKTDNYYYRRFNFRSNTNAEIAKGLNLNVSLSGRLDTRQAGRDDFQYTFKTLMINDRGTGPYVHNDPSKLTAIDPENKNVVALINPDIDGYRRYLNLQYQAIVELTYKIPSIKGLNLSIMGSYDGLQSNDSRLHKKYDLYNYLTGEYVCTNGAGSYTSTLRLNSKGYMRGQVNYDHTFNEKHNLSLLGVVEMTGTRYDGLESLGLYADIFTTDIINGTTASERSSNGYREFTRMAAYLGKINYDYSGKYLLEAVFRYDGSYRYAPSKRWVLFPSASVGWRISEESFIKNKLPFINNLKLRASYGESGRDAGTAFQYVAGYTVDPARSYIFNDGTMTSGMVPPGVVNDNLSWITSITTNVALDFEMMRGLIGGTFEYFQRKNTGLLATRIQSVPNTFGASFPQENIDSNLNQGIDIELTHRNKIGKDFNYSVKANFTYARDKTLHSERAPFSSQWDRWQNGNEDRYAERMWMHQWSGQYSSIQEYQTAPLMGGAQGNSRMLPGSYKILDLNGDGIIDNNDRTPDNWRFGRNPPIQFGFTLTAKYKAFDMSALFQGASGYTVNYRNNDAWGYGRFPALHEKYLDRWHTVNITDDPYNPASNWVTGYYPALRSNTSNTTDYTVISIWRPNATYLRMKSVELGYNIPESVLQKVNLSSARVFVNGYNLLTFCNKLLKQADPERQERDWDAMLAYPLMKTVNVGVNINF